MRAKYYNPLGSNESMNLADITDKHFPYSRKPTNKCIRNDGTRKLLFGNYHYNACIMQKSVDGVMNELV